MRDWYAVLKDPPGTLNQNQFMVLYLPYLEYLDPRTKGRKEIDPKQFFFFLISSSLSSDGVEVLFRRNTRKESHRTG